jgi:5-oxoprolinase (ATP-hydrolysing)
VFDDGGAGDPVLGRLARPPRRYRRHGARLDDAVGATVEEEGVLIDNFKLVEEGAFREEDAAGTSHRAHRYPARNVVQNVADLKAQVAANEKGVAELRRMVEQFGLDAVIAYMGTSRTMPRRVFAASSTQAHDSSFRWIRWTRAARHPACGSEVDHDRREATVDFTGTSPAAATTTSTHPSR